MAKSASGEDKANPVFLLATQAILALSGYLALVPREKCSRFGHDKSVVDKAYSLNRSFHLLFCKIREVKCPNEERKFTTYL